MRGNFRGLCACQEYISVENTRFFSFFHHYKLDRYKHVHVCRKTKFTHVILNKTNKQKAAETFLQPAADIITCIQKQLIRRLNEWWDKLCSRFSFVLREQCWFRQWEKENLRQVMWHTVCAAESTEGREHGERAQSQMITSYRVTDRQTDSVITAENEFNTLYSDDLTAYVAEAVSTHRCIVSLGVIILRTQGGSLNPNTTREEQETVPQNPARIQQMAMIFACSRHVNIKKEAHASFIRQYKSNIKDVALSLSVITACRFGLNHKELPVMSEGKRGLWFLTKGRQNEDQIVGLFAKLAIFVYRKHLFIDISATASNWWICCLIHGC